MMSDFEDMDVVLANGNVNPNEQELTKVIANSGGHCDDESNLQPREKYSRENDFGRYVYENMIPRLG